MDNSNIEKFKQEYKSVWSMDKLSYIPVKMNDRLIILEYLPPRDMQISIVKNDSYVTIQNLSIQDSIDMLCKLHKEYKDLVLDVGSYYNPIINALWWKVSYTISTATREEMMRMSDYRMTFIGLYAYTRHLEYNEELLKEEY